VLSIVFFIVLFYACIRAGAKADENVKELFENYKKMLRDESKD